MTIKMTTFPNAKGEWFWHGVSRNGRILVDGSEGYTRKASAQRAAEAFVDLVVKGPVEFVTLDEDPRITRSTKAAAKAKAAPVKKAVAKKAPAKKAAAKKAPAKKK